jgi:predicted naringenin-chalcone synthase
MENATLLSDGIRLDRRAPPVLMSVATALPPLAVSQEEILRFILARVPMQPSTRALYQRVFRNNAIERRFFALSSMEESLEPDPDRVSARFETWAVSLSRTALDRAVQKAGLQARDLDFLAVATCTGYLCPGLSAYVIEACGLRPDIASVDVVGMGCGAALPALQQAAAFVQANPGKRAAVVCTEICSAAAFWGDAPDLVVTNALFADGSAAVILGGGPEPSPDDPETRPALPRIHGFASVTFPAWRDTLRFRTDRGRLRNVLGKDVPAQAAEALDVLISRLLAGQGVPAAEVRRWIFHPGGGKVLDAVSASLGLSDADLAASRRVLKNFGNMSSPTVLFVLADEQAARPPEPGEWGVLASFGAGFTAHAALVRW